jgi:hypothetical protein
LWDIARLPTWTLVVLACAALLPAAASAQDPFANDPEAGSPSGTMYEIPVQGGRADAAPSGSGAPARGGSPIRSENGFGSSAVVPGGRPAAAGSRDRARGSSGRTAAGAKDAQPGDPEIAPVTLAAASGGPSPARTGLLLALTVLVGAGVGVAGRLSSRWQRGR